MAQQNKREIPHHLSRRTPSPNHMVWVPGGEFIMGSNHHYPEESPAHRVRVDGFWMDETPVTNEQFAQFVVETGYITFAEFAPKAEDYPHAPPEMLKAGSVIFKSPQHQVTLNDFSAWWGFEFGAYWQSPYGKGSTLEGLEKHPVVHIGYTDALAYASWAGKVLPSEAEWEFAAIGGVEVPEEFAWGSELTPEGKQLANIWYGEFPYERLTLGNYAYTSPVRTFPANALGIYDLIGNVWEWTSDFYQNTHTAHTGKTCCTPKNPRNIAEKQSYDPQQPNVARMVVKGGSHLCAANYCRRYRPAARQPQAVDTSTSHIGFRCIQRL
ncbi:formylglycine-generating enzyme family protein [Acinetobacter sp. WZC-1]|uniref:formylglycine-generating enzyme family protein n=1 Tax=Acinetobacter sp. WZC-1 TaxID=3459034 RepID=UPI00403D804F